MLVELHVHSCLSPCADHDMTPANICGMAHIKGLEAIAVTDHNTARNLPYVKEAADYYGLIFLPGMEITTKEEVPLLGYFRDVETAVEVGEFFSSHLNLNHCATLESGNITTGASNGFSQASLILSIILSAKDSKLTSV